MTIGDLVVTLGMNASRFKSGARESESALSKMQKGVTKLGSVFGGVWGRIAGLAGIGTFGAMTSSALSAIDTNAKLADSLGLTTEALAGLQHAGDLSGISTDQMSKALSKFSRGLGQARQGIGTAKDVLQQFGMSSDALASMAPDQAFLRVSEAIRGLPSEADRAAAAFGLFGRSGQQMLPLIMSGADGIKDMMDETKRLGTAFSRIDAAKVEAANDAMTRMKQAVYGIATQVAIGVAPAIEYMANSFSESAGWIAKVMGDASTAVSLGWTNTADVVSLAGLNMWQSLATVSPEMMGLWETLFKFVGSGAVGIGSFFQAMYSNISGGLMEYYNLWAARIEGIQVLLSTLSFSKAEEAFQKAFSAQANQPKWIDPVERMVIDAESAFAGMSEQIKASGGFMEHLQSSTRELSDKIVADNEKLFSMSQPFSLPGLELPGVGSTAKSGTNSGPVTALQGSAEAYKLINAAASRQADAHEQYMKRAADKQLAATKETNTLLKQVAAGVTEPVIEETDI